MGLSKIKKEDIVFSNPDDWDRVYTTVNLDDYDWMQYKLTASFEINAEVLVEATFEYFGCGSWLYIEQRTHETSVYYKIEFPQEIFQKHIIEFLKKHIASWDEEYAFNGEDLVIDFYNDAIEHGKVCYSKEE